MAQDVSDDLELRPFLLFSASHRYSGLLLGHPTTFQPCLREALSRRSSDRLFSLRHWDPGVDLQQHRCALANLHCPLPILFVSLPSVLHLLRHRTNPSVHSDLLVLGWKLSRHAREQSRSVSRRVHSQHLL